MKIYILFLCAFFPFFVNFWLQVPDLDFVETVIFEDHNAKEFKNLTNFPGSGNLLLVDDYRAIFQLGTVEVGLLDLNSGKTLRTLDMHELLRWVSEAVYAEKGGEFCIPGKEGFSARVKPEYYPIRFDRVMHYPGRGNYATLTQTVILNQDEKEEERALFFGLLVFSEELEILDYLPLKGYKEAIRSPSMLSGGFFHEDIMFTKLLSHNHERNYEFIKFRKTPQSTYEMADTMHHWPIVDKSIRISGTIYNFIETEGEFHIPLLDKIHIVENWEDEGALRILPLQTDQYLHSLEGLSQSQWKVAVIANTYLMDEWDRLARSRQLSLINPGYTRIIPVHDYSSRSQSFLSLSTYENKVALLFYERKERVYTVELYEFREDF